MVAPVRFTLDHVLDVLVDACVQEIAAAKRWVAIAVADRAALEAKIELLEGKLEERDAELLQSRCRVAELESAAQAEAQPVEIEVTGPATPGTPEHLAHPLKPPRMATPEERAAPPNNPRLTGMSTLVGQTFGTWKVVDRGASGGAGLSYWACICQKCGAKKELAGTGAFSLRRIPPPWCPACRARKGRKAAKPVEPEDDGEDEFS